MLRLYDFWPIGNRRRGGRDIDGAVMGIFRNDLAMGAEAARARDRDKAAASGARPDGVVTWGDVGSATIGRLIAYHPVGARAWHELTRSDRSLLVRRMSELPDSLRADGRVIRYRGDPATLIHNDSLHNELVCDFDAGFIQAWDHTSHCSIMDRVATMASAVADLRAELYVESLPLLLTIGPAMASGAMVVCDQRKPTDALRWAIRNRELCVTPYSTDANKGRIREFVAVCIGDLAWSRLLLRAGFSLAVNLRSRYWQLNGARLREVVDELNADPEPIGAGELLAAMEAMSGRVVATTIATDDFEIGDEVGSSSRELARELELPGPVKA